MSASVLSDHDWLFRIIENFTVFLGLAMPHSRIASSLSLIIDIKGRQNLRKYKPFSRRLFVVLKSTRAPTLNIILYVRKANEWYGEKQSFLVSHHSAQEKLKDQLNLHGDVLRKLWKFLFRLLFFWYLMWKTSLVEKGNDTLENYFSLPAFAITKIGWEPKPS